MLYSIELGKHILRFDEKDLDYLWDCIIGNDIKPNYNMILKVIESDHRLLEKIVMFDVSDTEVRDGLYINIESGKYKDSIEGQYENQS